MLQSITRHSVPTREEARLAGAMTLHSTRGLAEQIKYAVLALAGLGSILLWHAGDSLAGKFNSRRGAGAKSKNEEARHPSHDLPVEVLLGFLK